MELPPAANKTLGHGHGTNFKLKKILSLENHQMQE